MLERERVRGPVAEPAWLMLLVTAGLAGGACTGEHRGAREDNLVPALACTFAPAMTTEIPRARLVDAMAAHRDHIYFAIRGGGVWQVPKLGGPPVEDVVAPVPLVARTQPTEASDDSYVYRLDYGPQEIVRVKKDGSSRTVLASAGSESDSFTMLLFGQWLYWTSSDGSLHRVPKDGGVPATTIATFGAYDDDDYRGLLTVDLDGAYYLAGLPGQRAHDDDPLWLIRACR